MASDVVKVKSEDPATPGDRARCYVGNSQSFVLSCLLARLWGTPRTVTIPQYRLNKTKPHSHSPLNFNCPEPRWLSSVFRSKERKKEKKERKKSGQMIPVGEVSVWQNKATLAHEANCSNTAESIMSVFWGVRVDVLAYQIFNGMFRFEVIKAKVSRFRGHPLGGTHTHK